MPGQYLKVTASDFDGLVELFVEVEGNGFRGHANGYYGGGLEAFIEAALTYPLPKGLTVRVEFGLFMGYGEKEIAFEVFPWDDRGQVGFKVETRADRTKTGEFSNSASITLLTTYEPLKRFLTGLLALVTDPSSQEAVLLEGEQ